MKIEDAKKWLRAFARRQRASISAPARARYGRQAVRNLIRRADYKRAKVVAVYLSFGSELETRGLIDRAWRDGKIVLLPVTSRGLHRPFFAEYRRSDSLKKTKYGPLELAHPQKPFPWKKIDLVVVPGLAFDARGHRLGYGGGTYDRILAKTNPHTHVGLFFSQQALHCLPINKNDHPLKYVSTQNGIVDCLANR